MWAAPEGGVAMQIDFPYQIDRQGHTASTGDEAHIRDMLEQVIFTMPGERVNRPTFGSGVMQLVFEPNSEELATAVQFLIQGSLQQWLGELIVVEAVQVTSQESTIEVLVQYLLRRTQQRRIERFSRPT
jgi:phage baseplate assembly protein W